MFYKFKKKYKKIINRYSENAIQKEQRTKRELIEKQVNSCGKNLKVFGDVQLVCPEKVFIGDDCRLNDLVFINARSGVVIGDDVTISHGAKLISTGYNVEHWIENGEKKHIENEPIHIGNHCWIGASAIILPGIKITGEYVVVAAGAIVTKSISESKVILAGNPAKIVKRM